MHLSKFQGKQFLIRKLFAYLPLILQRDEPSNLDRWLFILFSIHLYLLSLDKSIQIEDSL